VNSASKKLSSIKITTLECKGLSWSSRKIKEKECPSLIIQNRIRNNEYNDINTRDLISFLVVLILLARPRRIKLFNPNFRCVLHW